MAYSALDAACYYSDVRSVIQLISIGIKPNEHTLTEACNGKNIEIVQIVIAIGALSNKYTLTGAFESKSIGLIQEVVAVGAKSNEYTLGDACRTGSIDIVLCDLVLRTIYTRYALCYALYYARRSKNIHILMAINELLSVL